MNRRTELLVIYFVVSVLVILALVSKALELLKISLIEGDKWRAKGSKCQMDGGGCRSRQTFMPMMKVYWLPPAVLWNTNDCHSAWCQIVHQRSIHSPYVEQIGQEQTKPTVNGTDIVPGKKTKKNRHLFIAKGLDTEEVNWCEVFLSTLGQICRRLPELRYGTRKKPFNQLASRTIGEDRKRARKGLEGYFDKFLKGTNG